MIRPRVLTRSLGALVALVAAAACTSGAAAPTARTSPLSSPPSSPSTAVRSSLPHTTAKVTSGAPRPRDRTSTAPVRTEITAERRRAVRRIRRISAYLGAGGMSVVALRPGGRPFRVGARGGMRSASIAKLYILETLLLQHQRSGHRLGEEQRELATRMIENSDNDAANELYEHIGEGPALRRVAGALHVHHTVPGPGIYWGYNQTCAADNVALLANLLHRRPLRSGARHFALRLLAHVESDQQWGVSAAADPDTTVRVKNGWLAADPDDDRWIVNSIGLITVGGRRMLLAVLTQHGPDFDSGIDLVERIARIAARAAA